MNFSNKYRILVGWRLASKEQIRTKGRKEKSDLNHDLNITLNFLSIGFPISKALA